MNISHRLRKCHIHTAARFRFLVSLIIDSLLRTTTKKAYPQRASPACVTRWELGFSSKMQRDFRATSFRQLETPQSPTQSLSTPGRGRHARDSRSCGATSFRCGCVFVVTLRAILWPQQGGILVFFVRRYVLLPFVSSRPREDGMPSRQPGRRFVGPDCHTFGATN